MDESGLESGGVTTGHRRADMLPHGWRPGWEVARSQLMRGLSRRGHTGLCRVKQTRTNGVGVGVHGKEWALEVVSTCVEGRLKRSTGQGDVTTKWSLGFMRPIATDDNGWIAPLNCTCLIYAVATDRVAPNDWRTVAVFVFLSVCYHLRVDGQW